MRECFLKKFKVIEGNDDSDLRSNKEALTKTLFPVNGLGSLPSDPVTQEYLSLWRLGDRREGTV